MPIDKGVAIFTPSDRSILSRLPLGLMPAFRTSEAINCKNCLNIGCGVPSIGSAKMLEAAYRLP